MNVKIENRMTIKLFIGCPLNSEAQMYLGQSNKWKQVAISPLKNREELIEVHHHGKNYLGYYLDSDQALLADLQKLELSVKEKLSAYCPNYESIPHPCIFAQVFVA